MTKFFFCQRQVSEFRPQLRFPNEKAPLFPYDSVLQTILILKVWLSGIYWSQNISSASSKDSDFFSIFPKFPATKKPGCFLKGNSIIPAPALQWTDKPLLLQYTRPLIHGSSVSPKSLVRGPRRAVHAGSRLCWRAAWRAGFSQRHATDKTWHWAWSWVFVVNSGLKPQNKMLPLWDFG